MGKGEFSNSVNFLMNIFTERLFSIVIVYLNFKICYVESTLLLLSSLIFIFFSLTFWLPAYSCVQCIKDKEEPEELIYLKLGLKTLNPVLKEFSNFTNFVTNLPPALRSHLSALVRLLELFPSPLLIFKIEVL